MNKEKLFRQIAKETNNHCDTCVSDFFRKAGYDGRKTGECDCNNCTILDDIRTAFLSLTPVSVSIFIGD